VEPTPGAGPRYDRGVIWEPFVLALFLGLIVSAGLYFAYMWPSVEPLDAEPVTTAADSPSAAPVADEVEDEDRIEEHSGATRKAEARKAENKRAAESTDDRKASTKKADDKLAEAKKTADKHAADKKVEPKVDDKKPDEAKVEDKVVDKVEDKVDDDKVTAKADDKKPDDAKAPDDNKEASADSDEASSKS
jgi:hypothetical protein